MITVLLAVIAGVLSFQLLDDATKGDDPVLLIFQIPMFVALIVVATLVVLGIAWGMNYLLQFAGFYLD